MLFPILSTPPVTKTKNLRSSVAWRYHNSEPFQFSSVFVCLFFYIFIPKEVTVISWPQIICCTLEKKNSISYEFATPSEHNLRKIKDSHSHSSHLPCLTWFPGVNWDLMATLCCWNWICFILQPPIFPEKFFTHEFSKHHLLINVFFFTQDFANMLKWVLLGQFQ